MPGVSNSTCPEAPGATRPVSNELSAAVAVCAWVPRFTHWIDWPAGTLTAKPQVLMSAGSDSTIANGAALVASADTTRKPFIVGCTEQMYAKVPAVANVTLADAPGATRPLSNEP